ncbi:mycothiol synthase [Nesterenkonia ebinurensis]|uniref:mycothiol synthase n=1 Tax=Nesterenkonia ebinurensis TaxID=2608252 RepID=UPI00123D7FD0|nr:mycothiol synthase [Nesterenkonia ebinurensis]
MGFDVELVQAAPTAEQLRALRELASAAQRADGAPPFGDQTWVELTSDKDDAVALACTWVQDDDAAAGTLAGAGVVVLGHADKSGEDSAPNVLELAVHPDFRQRGIGTQLAAALNDSVLAQQPGTAHRAWAHGGHPGAPRLAARCAWTPVRELWQMRLSNETELPETVLPEGVQLRSFQPGRNEQDWLQVNAAAFADHPEQGRMTLEDLQARMAEDWFSAEGFLMAWDSAGDSEQLLGFHWTKMHSHDDGERLGEVYVVGVAPAAQGRKLGKALTIAGIEHLRSQSVATVLLYVDAENTAAVRLYEDLGFTVTHTDVQYAPIEETRLSREET